MVNGKIRSIFTDFIRNELRNWHWAEITFMTAAAATVVVITLMTGGDNAVGVISAVTGIMYTLLAGKGKSSCYLFGLINSFLYGLIAMKSRIFGDMLLNWGYYFPMQIVGLFFWMRHYDPEKGEVIKKILSPAGRGIFVLTTLAVWAAFAWLLARFNARAPYLDSATTVLSVGAMILSVMRCFEQWICWTLVNLISIFMWYQIYRTSGNSLATLLMWGVFLLCGIIFACRWHIEAGETEK